MVRVVSLGRPTVLLFDAAAANANHFDGSGELALDCWILAILYINSISKFQLYG